MGRQQPISSPPSWLWRSCWEGRRQRRCRLMGPAPTTVLEPTAAAAAVLEPAPGTCAVLEPTSSPIVGPTVTDAVMGQARCANLEPSTGGTCCTVLEPTAGLEPAGQHRIWTALPIFEARSKANGQSLGTTNGQATGSFGRRTMVSPAGVLVPLCSQGSAQACPLWPAWVPNPKPQTCCLGNTGCQGSPQAHGPAWHGIRQEPAGHPAGSGHGQAGFHRQAFR